MGAGGELREMHQEEGNPPILTSAHSLQNSIGSNPNIVWKSCRVKKAVLNAETLVQLILNATFY